MTWLTGPVIAWAMYDFANTIFSYAVVTRYFNDWVINDLHQPDWTVGVMGLAVSVALIFCLPLAGAVADETGARKPLLAAFTGLCVLACAALTVVGAPLTALIVGGLAIFGFNAALAHYDPLLDQVAAPDHHARVSALGVALGYVGVLFALAVLGHLAGGRNQAAFAPTALLFAVFALPLFLWVPGPARRPAALRLGALIARAARDVHRSVTHARQLPYGRFLLARFLYVDAIATVIAFMAVYAKRVPGFDTGSITMLLAASIVFAIAGAAASGVISRRRGPVTALTVTIVAVVGALIGCAALNTVWALWIAGPVVGAALGAVNTADRVLMLRLAAPEHRGEAFGLYALVGKLSSGMGPLILWGGVIWLTHDKLDLLTVNDASRLALAALACAAAAGGYVLRGVREPAD